MSLRNILKMLMNPMILPKNRKYFLNKPRFVFSKNIPTKLRKEEVLENLKNVF